MDDHSQITHLPFTVDARIIAQLGDQLVPSDLMALAELVKNAYDADATNVSIDYSEVTGVPTLVVEDDGNGMSLEQLRSGWMHIGTAEKERSPYSPHFGRPCAGLKGVGRFAALRLGRHLRLSTTQRGSDTSLLVDFDWNMFLAGKPLDSILHEVQTAVSTEATQGTRLEITSPRRCWTLDQLAGVIKDLSRLHVPSKAPAPAHGTNEVDPGFEVVAAYQDNDGLQLVDELDLLREERVVHLHGEIDSSGNGTYTLEFFRPEREVKHVSFKKPLSTGPLTLDVDLAILAADWIHDLGVRKARAIGRKHGGIRVWRDGFRVFPFGEPGDDWLGIEEHVAARRQPLTLWRNQGMLGGVRISRRDNPKLQDLLTRRGMIETLEFQDMKDFVFEGLVIAATEHAAVSARKSRSTRQRSRPSDALATALEDINADSGRLLAPAGTELGNSSRHFLDPTTAGQLVDVVRGAELEFVNENQMLKVLASLGTGLAVFGHEMKTVSLQVAGSASALDRLAAELPQELRPRLELETSRLRTGLESLSTYARYVEDFVSQEARTRRQSVELSVFLDFFFSVFQPLLNRRSIQYQISVPRGLWTRPMFRAELLSIFFNLLTNAVKALLSPGIRERRLCVIGSECDGQIVTHFADTGCGVPSDVADELFEPFVTRSHNPGDANLGRGTGLGLYIVREIVADYDGEAILVRAPEGYTTGIEIRLPARTTP